MRNRCFCLQSQSVFDSLNFRAFFVRPLLFVLWGAFIGSETITSRDILGRFLFIFILLEIVFIFRGFWDFCIRWYLRRLSLPGFSEVKCFELTSAKSFEVFPRLTRDLSEPWLSCPRVMMGCSVRGIRRQALEASWSPPRDDLPGLMPEAFRGRVGGPLLISCSRHRLGKDSWRDLRGVLWSGSG